MIARWRNSAGVAAALFGAATIASGGNALFGGPGARAAAGNAVPFVLWFNFLGGFAYLAGAAGLLLRRRWAEALAWAIALATLGVYAAFGVAAASGAAFEMRTVAAMFLRSGFWLAVALALAGDRRQNAERPVSRDAP